LDVWATIKWVQRFHVSKPTNQLCSFWDRMGSLIIALIAPTRSRMRHLVIGVFWFALFV
jgi:hypothetical protein